MTPEEFKKKFKIGDLIKSNDIEYVARITALGEYSFLCVRINDNCEYWYFYNQMFEWIKVEPEKKPSDGINEIVKSIGHSQSGDAEYIRAIAQWLDENWPKVVKK